MAFAAFIILQMGCNGSTENKASEENTSPVKQTDEISNDWITLVINLGYRASDYFKKYPGRFVSSHLSDWTADKKEVPIGQGVIDWKEFFAAAKTGGVKNFFVEMSPDKFKDSAEYIQKL